MPTYKSVPEFLDNSRRYPVIDVRAPIEFDHAHIPGAHNIPLFSTEQRAEIGTLYRQQGRVESVLRALEFVGPKMRSLAESARSLARDNTVCLHCWRGGMRSSSFAWLIENIDLKAIVLQGGYKAYRRHVLKSFKHPLKLIVLSGLTGAGKTPQLQQLEKHGEQVVDLENLAKHRGSAFGGIGLETQPSVEQFENQLLAKLSTLDHSRRIWVEDESRSIGSVKLPHHFFEQIRIAPAIFMDVSPEVRNRLIRGEYGCLSEQELIAATQRITKRLGGKNAQAAIAAIEQQDWPTAISILLNYYDKLYLANKAKLDRTTFIDLPVADPLCEQTTGELVAMADNFPHPSRSRAEPDPAQARGGNSGETTGFPPARE